MAQVRFPLHNSPPTVSPGDATAVAKGLIQLSGDLSGTATAPTVPGLASKYAKPPSGIPETDLSSGVQTKLNAATSISDASPTNKGLVQLAGDLGGTAAAPTVPGLASKADSTTVIAAGTGLTGGGNLTTSRTLSVVNDTSTQRLRLSKGGGLTGTRQELNLIEGTNVTITTSDDVVNNRVNVTLSAAGASDATTSSKGLVQLAGDLGGTAAAPTVPGLASKLDISARGTANGVASLDNATRIPITQIPVAARLTEWTSTTTYPAGTFVTRSSGLYENTSGADTTVDPTSVSFSGGELVAPGITTADGAGHGTPAWSYLHTISFRFGRNLNDECLRSNYRCVHCRSLAAAGIRSCTTI